MAAAASAIVTVRVSAAELRDSLDRLILLVAIASAILYDRPVEPLIVQYVDRQLARLTHTT